MYNSSPPPSADSLGGSAPSILRSGDLSAIGRLGSWEEDLATGRVRVSPAWEALLGVTPGHFQAVDNPLHAVLDPAGADAFEARRQRLVKGGDPDPGLVVHYGRADGTAVPVLSRASLRYDDRGRPVCLMGVDIALEGLPDPVAPMPVPAGAPRDRLLTATLSVLTAFLSKEGQRHLHDRAVVYLKQLSGALESAVVRLTPEGDRYMFEERARSAWRTGADPLSEDDMQALCTPALRARKALLVKDFAAFAMEHQVDWQAGGLRHFCALPLIAQSRPVGLVALAGQEPLSDTLSDQLAPFLSALTHILSSECADIGRRQTEKELRTTEMVLSVATNSVAAPISVWDKQDRLLKYNESFLDQFPELRARDSLRGLPYHSFITDHLAPKLDLDRLPMPKQAFLEDYTQNNFREEPTELPMKSGRWLLVHKRLIPDIGTVAMSTDITEIKRREEAAQRQREEMESKNAILEALTRALRIERDKAENARLKADQASAAKSRFLAHMSHELRTPLNAILGFSELMQCETFGPLGVPKYHDYIDAIMQSGRHLLLLINDVLDMSRIEAGKLELHPEEVPVRESCEEALRLARKPESGELAPVQFMIPAELSMIYCDRRALVQILVNLLSNALKFTEVSGRITVSFEQKGAMLRLAVEDTGLGMTRRQIEKALTPFGQVEGYVSRNVQGTGLGLPLVKGLAEAHGGGIEIDSEPGVGTTVSVYLRGRDLA